MRGAPPTRPSGNARTDLLFWPSLVRRLAVPTPGPVPRRMIEWRPHVPLCLSAAAPPPPPPHLPPVADGPSWVPRPALPSAATSADAIAGTVASSHAVAWRYRLAMYRLVLRPAHAFLCAAATAAHGSVAALCSGDAADAASDVACDEALESGRATDSAVPDAAAGPPGRPPIGASALDAPPLTRHARACTTAPRVLSSRSLILPTVSPAASSPVAAAALPLNAPLTLPVALLTGHILPAAVTDAPFAVYLPLNDLVAMGACGHEAARRFAADLTRDAAAAAASPASEGEAGSGVDGRRYVVVRCNTSFVPAGMSRAAAVLFREERNTRVCVSLRGYNVARTQCLLCDLVHSCAVLFLSRHRLRGPHAGRACCHRQRPPCSLWATGSA